jgi:hypothetical protein
VDNPRSGSNIANAADTLLPDFVGGVGSHMSVLDAVESFRRTALVFRRQVSIRRDGADFVVAFEPDDIIVFRHSEANALRRACNSLRWEIVRDTTPDPNDLASW